MTTSHFFVDDVLPLARRFKLPLTEKDAENTGELSLFGIVRSWIPVWDQVQLEPSSLTECQLAISSRSLFMHAETDYNEWIGGT